MSDTPKHKPILLQRPFLGKAELDGLRAVFDEGSLTIGRYTQQFEQRVANLLQARSVVAVNTGTSALHLALEALGLERGDEVILPSLTFVAGVQAVLAADLTPVFCEVDEQTLLMDVDDALARRSDRTRVLMPVHFGGEVCDMQRLRTEAKAHNLRVVADAAHAFGSQEEDGRPVGTTGDITCFSFDPIKNITCGEGGAIVADDPQYIRKLRSMRRLGMEPDKSPDSPWPYSISERGWRYHLPNTNAAIGLAQLERMSAMREHKVNAVRRYDKAFGTLKHVTRIPHRYDRSFPFFYVLRVPAEHRADLMAHLRARQVSCGIHYPPNHLQPLCAPYRTSLPVTERVSGEILTLPLFYPIADEQIDRVIEAVRTFF